MRLYRYFGILWLLVWTVAIAAGQSAQDSYKLAPRSIPEFLDMMAYERGVTVKWEENVDLSDYDIKFKFKFGSSFEQALDAAMQVAEPKLKWRKSGSTYVIGYVEPVIKLDVDDKTPISEVVQKIFDAWGKPTGFRLDADRNALAPETHLSRSLSVSTALHTVLRQCNPPLVDDELNGIHYISALGTEGLPPILTQSGHAGRVLNAEYSPDRSVIATYGEDGFIVLWSTNDGHSIATIQGVLATHGLSLNGDKVVYARGSTAWVYDIVKKRSTAFGQSPGRILSIAFAPKAGEAITADQSGNLRLFSLAGGKALFPPEQIDPVTHVKRINLRYRSSIDMVSIAADASKAAFHFAVSDGVKHDSIYQIELPSGKTSRVTTLGPVAQISLNSQGDTLFSSSQQGWLSYWRSGDTQGRDLWARSSEREAFTRFGVSPDGKHVAYGYRNEGLRIANIADPNDIRTIPKMRLKSNIEKISCVSFGPNGKDLILGIDAPDFVPCKVFTYNLDRKEITLNLKRNVNTIFSIQFNEEGNLVIVNDGVGIRIWDPSMTEFPRSLELQSAAIQPHVKDDQEYVVAGANPTTGQLERWYVPLGRRSPVPIKYRFSNIDKIVWSGDGQSFAVHEVTGAMTVWRIDSEKPLYVFPAQIQNLSGFAINKDGSKLALCVSGQKGFVRIYDLAKPQDPIFKLDNEPEKNKEVPELRGPFAVGRGTDTIAFQKGGQLEVLNFSTGKAIGEYDGQNASFSEDGLLLAYQANDGVHLQTTSNGTEKILDGLMLPHLSPDGRRLVCFRQERNIAYIYDLSDGHRYQLSGGSSAITAVDFMPDRVKGAFKGSTKLVVSGTADGRIAFWDNYGKFLAESKSIDDSGTHRPGDIASEASYFIRSGNYYMASPDAARRIRFNEGIESNGFFDQYDLVYNRPDKVMEAINVADPKAVELARKAYFKRLKQLGLDGEKMSAAAEGLALPRVNVKGKVYSADHSKVAISVEAYDRIGTISGVTVTDNGVPIWTRRMDEKASERGIEFVTDMIPLTHGKNILRVSVSDSNGLEGRAQEEATGPSGAVKPDLWVVNIGVSHYRNNEDFENLAYGDSDAIALSDVFYHLKDPVTEKQPVYGPYRRVRRHHYVRDVSTQTVTVSQSRFANVHLHPPLVNESATRSNLLQIRSWLASAKPDDMVVLTFAGHGRRVDDIYYFATYDAKMDNMPGTAFSYGDLDDLFEGVAARQRLVLLDTCQSGEAEIGAQETRTLMRKYAPPLLEYKPFKTRGAVETIGGESDEFKVMQLLFSNLEVGSGATILAASTGSTGAQERSDVKHGAFTEAVLEGLGARRAQENGSVTAASLRRYVMQRVMELTNNMQSPTTRRQNTDYDFVLR